MSTNAARLQVIKGLRVELSHGRAVTAFDVVGINFKLRLCIHLGTVREQQIVVGLLRVGSVCADMDNCLAVPDTASIPGGNSPIVLDRSSGPDTMIDAGVVVDVLVIGREVSASQACLGARSLDVDAEIVAYETAAEVEGPVAEDGVARQSGRHARRLMMP